MLHKLEEISGMVNPDFIRLEFTIENENETRQVMDMLVDAVIHHDTSMIKSHINMYTMGHNNRGVE
jgi:hypothetical protein